MIGSPSGASQVLARKRHLTLEMILKISASWDIAIELLTSAYRLDRVSVCAKINQPKKVAAKTRA